MASGYTSIQEFLMVLRRGRWIVLALILVGGGAAFALSERADPVYRAGLTEILDQVADFDRVSPELRGGCGH